MVYAKIVDGSVDNYPVDEWDIRRAFPTTSFPAEFSPPEGYVPVEPTPADVEWDQVAAETTPVLDGGVWRQTWSIRDATEDEKNAIRARWECSRFQGRAALMLSGKLDAAAQAVADANDPMTSLAWNEATTWRRNSALLTGLAAELNLSAADLDDLFLTAMAIEV